MEGKSRDRSRIILFFPSLVHVEPTKPNLLKRRRTYRTRRISVRPIKSRDNYEINLLKASANSLEVKAAPRLPSQSLTESMINNVN